MLNFQQGSDFNLFYLKIEHWVLDICLPFFYQYLMLKPTFAPNE